MPFNKNFAKTDTAALHQMISGHNQNVSGGGAGLNMAGAAQEMFYPKQRRNN